MSYSFPEYSSSPAPSTPPKKSSNLFAFGASNPSTTPAGPPPSSAGSFTPAGAPPTTYGSSVFDNTYMKPLSFGQSNISNGSPLRFGESVDSEGYTPARAGFQESTLGSKHDTQPNRGYRAPSYSEDEEEPEEQGGNYAEGDYADEDEEEEHNGEEELYEDDEEEMEVERELSRRSTSEVSSQEDYGRSILGMKKSLAQTTTPIPERKVYGAIAKELYSRIDLPQIEESDNVVLGSDDVLKRLYGFTDDESLVEALSTIPGDLLKLWNGYQNKIAAQELGDHPVRIGPGPQASGFTKANFIADLTLRIYHPQIDSRNNQLKTLPQALLEWLNQHHDPYPSQLDEVASHLPAPASNELFWDTVVNSLLRGKIAPVLHLLKNAGWRFGTGERDQPRGHASEAGYKGVALSNVERVIAAAVEVLSQCPGYRGNWDVLDGDWTLFRIKTSHALQDLQRFAEGNDYHRKSASNIGSFSETAQKAQSAVPWSIYQRLVSIYRFIIGDLDAIVEVAEDWCEACIGLLVWWDEGRSKGRGMRNSQRLAIREPETDQYVNKLRNAFHNGTTQDLRVDTSDIIEVALATALEGDVESVIGFLRAWSGPVSAAVAEIGSLGGWLPQSEPQSLINMSLNEEDLMVLGIDSSPSKSDSIKDKTLIAYSKALTYKGDLKMTLPEGEILKEGWELAISTLGRLDSVVRSEEMVGAFLDKFKLDSANTVDKLWRLLNDIDMGSHAERTAEVYANSLAESSHNYGEALWYYALAHKKSKVKDVLDLLISYSLVQSVAYPPESEMDDHLRKLMNSPRQATVELSRLDLDAADLLYHAFTGYATLRSFYTVRDEYTRTSEGRKFTSLPRVRQSEAIAALLAVISSSSESISGGLYDEESEAVVSIDFLLAFLGEALVFVNNPETLLSVSHIDVLLRAIEDLQSVGPRVYSACTEFLQTVLASGHGLKGSTPADLLKKTGSNLSGSSSFSMVGSSMLASQLKQSMSYSGVLVKGPMKRGWDWREGLPAGITPDDLLRILRLGLAKKLASAWMAEVDNLC